MRIGMLAPPWLPVPPPAYGGTEAVVDTLCRGIAAAGHEVLLWTVGESTCPVERGSAYALAQTARMGDSVSEIHHVLTAYSAFAAWGADIVHDHTVVGPLIATGYPGPIVTTNHGPFDVAAIERFASLDSRIGIVSISADQARRAGEDVVTTVIHHGLDVDHFAVGPGAGDARGRYVVFLGRMAAEKGPAEAALIAREAGVRLLIAAKMHSAVERSYFACNVEPLLGPDVEYLGEVGHAEKVALLGGASALLNPISWPEPFGLAMVEALACGTPVVATRVGSVPEIVDDGITGFVCDDRDEMVERLRALHRIDRGACRYVAEERFSGQRMVRDHLALYQRLVLASPAREPSDATAGAAA